MPHDRRYTRLTKLEVDVLTVNTTLTNPGGAATVAGDSTVGGNLIFSTASAKVIPGATSLLIRNNADTASNVSITDAGVVTITGATVGNAQLIVTSTNASAFAVGRQGATAPAFLVDANTASSATGVKVTSAAAAGGVAVAAISSGTDEAMTIDSKGAGALTLNGTATGDIILGSATTKMKMPGGSNTTEGYIWYDYSAHALKYRDNSGTKTVTAS